MTGLVRRGMSASNAPLAWEPGPPDRRARPTDPRATLAGLSRPGGSATPGSSARSATWPGGSMIRVVESSRPGTSEDERHCPLPQVPPPRSERSTVLCATSRYPGSTATATSSSPAKNVKVLKASAQIEPERLLV